MLGEDLQPRTVSVQVFYLRRRRDGTSSSKSEALNRTETSLKNSVGAFCACLEQQLSLLLLMLPKGAQNISMQQC